uniref:Uncharacterized protein n=1 Tax=Arundo donax TaxID=35708 RepID=A0A0A8Z6M9_ARUDO
MDPSGPSQSSLVSRHHVDLAHSGPQTLALVHSKEKTQPTELSTTVLDPTGQPLCVSVNDRATPNGYKKRIYSLFPSKKNSQKSQKMLEPISSVFHMFSIRENIFKCIEI